MGASVGKRRGSGFADINVTPLVDVMLVLLVIFMITAPLLATGLRVELPEVKATESPLKDTQLIVNVKADGTIEFLGENVTENVEEVLIRNPKVQTEKELYIRADKNVKYGVVARVVAAARRAGVEGLNLLVQPEVEEDGAAPPATAVPVAPPSGKKK